MRNKVQEYFEAFSNKDVDKLRELYDDEISLRDWLSSASGKEDVIKSNQMLFDACSTVDVTLKNVVWEPFPESSTLSTAACEIDINLKHNDGTIDTLLVVDVIDFKEDKIKEIRAYLGNVE